jgi:hypothetical protein
LNAKNAISALCGIMRVNPEHGAKGLITKRMVGIALVLLGIGAIGGTVAVDLLGAGKSGGLGPAQQLAVTVGFTVSLVGLSLIPLGDRPA